MNWFTELALYWQILIVLMFIPWINAWTVMLILKNIFWIPSGWIMVPRLWKYRHTDYVDLPQWTKPWSNLEDWQGQPNHYKSSLPKWWVLFRISKGFEGTDKRSWIRYHAFRNGADGIRAFKLLNVNLYDGGIKYKTPFYMDRYEPKEMREAGKRAAGYFCWQGWQAGMKWLFIYNDKWHASIKIGWRMEPRHAKSPTNAVEQRLLDADPSRKILLTHRDFSSSPRPMRKG